MLATVYLVVTCVAGFAVATWLAPRAPTIVRLPAGFLLSVVVTSWTTYLVAFALSAHTADALTIGLIVSTVLGAVIIAVAGRNLRWRHLHVPILDAVLGIAALAFSYWLVNSHLQYDHDGELSVSANTWGDMGLHIALSRSFSVGANYPTEYPFFANEPIRYHFGFDFFAGMLQQGGFSVLWSFNLPGIIGFSAMLLTVFAIARLLFSPKPDGAAEPEGRSWWRAAGWWRDKGVWAGLIAAALVMTNQSLGWLRYVAKDGHGSMFTALRPSIFWQHKDYLTGGPYTDDRIVMFNTPNAYLTQMHLIVAMAVILFLTFVVLDELRAGVGLDKRVLLAVGIIFGLAFWLNGVVWLAAAVFFGMLLVIWALCACWRVSQQAPRAELAGRPSAGVGVDPDGCVLRGAGPRARGSAGDSAQRRQHGRRHAHRARGLPGLRVDEVLVPRRSDESGLAADWKSFFEYWWLNEGLFIPLLVLAFVLGNRRDKKIITAAAFIFIWGSLFQVGQDLGGQNHKVFNLWENVNSVFVGFALVEIWVVGGRLIRRGFAELTVLGVLARFVTVCMFAFLVVSGLVDFMTVKNDFKVSVFGDATEQQAIDWIVHDTPPRSAFLTDYDQLYTAPTMAGRGIALGYSSWASSAGYDIEPRKEAIEAIYSAPDRSTACSLLKQNEMDYVEVGPQERSSPRFKLNEGLFASMTAQKVVGSGPEAYAFYRVADNC